MPSPKDPEKRKQWIENLSKAHQGKTHSAEHRQNNSIAHQNQTMQEKGHEPDCQCPFCRGIRGEVKGENNSFYGRNHSNSVWNESRSTEIIPGQIPLIHGLWALVDDEDYDELIKYNWVPWITHGSTYVTRHVKSKRILMHRQILGLEDDDLRIVDFRDRNPLNNHRSNLRITDVQHDSWNRGPMSNCRSPLKGVQIDKNGTITAGITCYGKSYFLGRFDTEKAAAKAYDEMARELFGEFAYLNFPEEERTENNGE